MSLDGARLRLQALALALSGVRAAPDSLPANFTAYPIAITFAGAMNGQRHSAAHSTRLVTLVTEVHIARKDLGRDIKIIQPLMQAFVTAVLADVTLSGNVPSLIGPFPVRARMTPMEYGAVQTFGFRCEVDIHILES